MYGGGRERTESICGGKGREARVYAGEGQGGRGARVYVVQRERSADKRSVGRYGEKRVRRG